MLFAIPDVLDVLAKALTVQGQNLSKNVRYLAATTIILDKSDHASQLIADRLSTEPVMLACLEVRASRSACRQLCSTVRRVHVTLAMRTLPDG